MHAKHENNSEYYLTTDEHTFIEISLLSEYFTPIYGVSTMTISSILLTPDN